MFNSLFVHIGAVKNTLQKQFQIKQNSQDIQEILRELEIRLHAIEQPAQNLLLQTSKQNYDLSQKINDIKTHINLTGVESLNKEVGSINDKISDFLDHQIPSSIMPLSKTLATWKQQFNQSVSRVKENYKELNKKLSLNTINLQKASEKFKKQKESFSDLTEFVSSFPQENDLLLSDINEIIDNWSTEISTTFSLTSQKLNLDIARAKLVANLILNQPSSNVDSLKTFFDRSKDSVNIQCLQVEEKIKEINLMLKETEAQFQTESSIMKQEIKTKATENPKNMESDLRKKIIQAKEKLNQLDNIYF